MIFITILLIQWRKYPFRSVNLHTVKYFAKKNTVGNCSVSELEARMLDCLSVSHGNAFGSSDHMKHN